MKPTKIWLKIILIQFVIAMGISYFNNIYGAMFLFGGASICYFLEYFGLLKQQPTVKHGRI